MSTVVCSLCAAPLPANMDAVALAEVTCSCGQTGSWERAPSTLESMEAEVKDALLRALEAGVSREEATAAVERALRELD